MMRLSLIVEDGRWRRENSMHSNLCKFAALSLRVRNASSGEQNRLVDRADGGICRRDGT